MADLSTLAAVKNQLNIGRNGTLNVVDDDILSLYVTQASQMFETECQRTFGTLGETATYDTGYPVTEGRTLFFDKDWLSVDRVVNGANGTLTGAHYRLLPLNSSPKYALQLLDSTGMFWSEGYDGYAQNAIQVTGTSGYSTTVPTDVTLAVTKLAAFLYQTRDQDGSSIQLADGSTVIPANAPPLVLRTITKYVRRVAYTGERNR